MKTGAPHAAPFRTSTMKTRHEASGWQIAFLTLAVSLISVPIANYIIRATGPEWGGHTVARLFTLGAGAILLVAFPAVRRRTAEYLRRPVPDTSRAEVLLLTLSSALVAFAIAGGIVLWHIARSGIDDAGNPANAGAQLTQAFSKEGLLFLFAACLVAPIVEELVFRGFLFDAWQRRWGWKRSALLTSTVFALYHAHFFAAFVLSILLVCLRRRTGTIRAPMIMHAFMNLILWYPLLGRYVFPHVVAGPEAIYAWVPHLAALAISIIAIPAYIALAAARPAPEALRN